MTHNWSMLNSTVKTYPSKKNRTSQSCRLSSYAPHHPFLEDDGEPADLFDRLVGDEKVKGPNQSSLAGSIDQTMQSLAPKRNTLLRSVDNVLSEDRHRVKKKTKRKDKENVRYRSGLFVDDDEEDPYLFNLNSEKKVRCKSSKVRGSTLNLREQKIKSTKLRKAQELREKQQLERDQWRMSKVCSTPNGIPIISNDVPLDCSYIGKVVPNSDVDYDPESTAPSDITYIRSDNMEKSSDIFMSATSKPTIRVKLSFSGTFREDCKTLSPNLPEWSCCDQDGHKNSGSSGARSVESANSNYLTCLKVISSDERDEASCHSRRCNTGPVNNLNDSCRSQHSQSHPEKTPSDEIIVMDCADLESRNGSILLAEDLDDGGCDSEIVSPLPNDCSNKFSNVNPELSKSELRVLDSEDSENEVGNLTSDVDNLRLTDTSEITSNTDRDTAHSPNESCTSDRSTGSDYSISLNWSEVSDKDGFAGWVDESKNLADRPRRKPDSVGRTDEPAFVSPRPLSRWSDAMNESSHDVSASNRRATRLFFSRPSSELAWLEDSNVENSASTWSTSGSPSMEVTSTICEVMSETESKSVETKEEDVIRACPSTQMIEQRKARVFSSQDEEEDLYDTEADEPDTLESSDMSVAANDSRKTNFFDRVPRIYESDPDRSDGPTLNEDTVIENTAKIAKATTSERVSSEKSLIERRNQPPRIYEEHEEEDKEDKEPNNVIFESTRLSKGVISETGATTNSFDDTFSIERTIIVENIAPAAEQKTPGPASGGSPPVTSLDDLSPIEKAVETVEPSSIVSTVKRRHRVAAGRRRGQHVVFFDTLSEEKETGGTSEEEGETFEDTRTNASQIFRRPADSRSHVPESSFFSHSRFNNSSLSAVHLEKGKKWRRSFIAFKNIMNHHKLSMVAKEDCGRLYNRKIENLISLQNDASIIRRELEECSTPPKTGSDETVVAGFEEGDNTIAARYGGRQEKARFSLCINVPNALCDISRRTPECEDVGEKSRRRARKTRARQIEAGDFANISRWNSTLLERCCVSTNVAREIVLKYCDQTEPVPFDACFSDRVLKNCSKIGEGVYGEVFLLTRGCKKSVIKIIPIEGDQLVNGERQKTFEEIFSELAITSHLSDLNEKGSFHTECFARLVNRHCVYGRYPRRLITLWKEYDLNKGSENDSPALFEDDQLYIILELDHGGEDIESFAFNNAQQTLSVFNQVAHALAVAEQAFQFEHRDLHWGNILVTRCSRKKTKFVIQNQETFVNLNGVKVTIIDYTLSRITIKKHTLFNDLGKDPDLFIAEGDFQFEVYRMMRNAVKDIWDTYAPVTNVYWLRYLLDKMVKEIKYIRSNSALHRTSFAELEEMYARISRDQYVSASQIANSECGYN